MTTLYCGTSGYTNDDWRGIFYPPGLASQDYLGYYAARFGVLELNSSFYALPSAGLVEKLQRAIQETAHPLHVILKVHHDITHRMPNLSSAHAPVPVRNATVQNAMVQNATFGSSLPDDADIFMAWVKAVAPLLKPTQLPLEKSAKAGGLVACLLQFPASFQRTPHNRRYLAMCLERFNVAAGALGLSGSAKGIPFAIAFRHSSWDTPAVQKSLAAAGVAWVSCDYPRLAPLPKPTLHVTTPDTAYIRMHGRNEGAWWTAKTAAARHDYRYDQAELVEWLTQIQAYNTANTTTQKLENIFCIFANTTKGHALANIAMLKTLAPAYGLAIGVQDANCVQQDALF